MKKIILSILTALCLYAVPSLAEEKLLYATDFQDWEAVSMSDQETVVTKTTDFSRETLSFTLWQAAVAPTGSNPTKFDAVGYIQTNKTSPSPYVVLSPLQSITRIAVSQAATGGSRGIAIWKKSKSDADWVEIHNKSIVTARGETLEYTIGDGSEEEVALKFTSFAPTQNAHITDLKIYGNYTSTVEQVSLTAAPSITEGGTITFTPASPTYDIQSEVQVLFTPAFGYRFIKWVDEEGNILSETPEFSITLTKNRNITAQVEQTTTYAFELKIEGSRWGRVALSPEPVNGRYEAGTIVSMSIVPREVCTFQYWEDQSSEDSRSIEVTADLALTATFDEKPFIVGWDFADQTTKQSKTAEFYSDSENQGVLSLHKPDGSKVNWLSNAGSFSPLLPCARMWTSAANFDSERRYYQAAFATKGYSSVEVRSLVSGNYQLYSIIKMQYSLNGVDFLDLASVDITSNYNATWAPCNAVLPEEACNAEQVYIRWSGDVNSPKLGATTENDGTALTNIYVYAEPIVTDDSVAPQLISIVPAQQSQTASASGNIVLTFNEKVKVGTGDVTLNGTTLTPIAGSKTVAYAYNKLQYNTSYSVVIPSGAITDLAGNAYEGITLTFTTKNRPRPIAKLFDCIVAADGSGDFTSVQDAIDAAPSGRQDPYLIFIKEGRYTGHVDIPSTKPFIHLIGQDKERVILTDNRLSGGDNAYHVSQGATVVVNAKDFYAENISFENSWGVEQQAGPQALALYTVTDRAALKNCKLRSFQDTYLTAYNEITDRAYLEECLIEGAVDYIYGGGDVFFEKCTLFNMRSGGYIVAPSHKENTAWGYVFNNCTIDGVAEANGTIWLGRPWQNTPKTVFLNARLNINIKPEAWFQNMGAIPAVFADYGTMDAEGYPVDASQRNSYYWYIDKETNNKVEGTAKSSLTDEEAAAYTREAVLNGSDNWDPTLMTERIEAATEVVWNGTTVSWEASEYAICYVVYHNDKVVAFTKETSYTPASRTADSGYSVQAVSEYGSLSAKSVAQSSLDIGAMPAPTTVQIYSSEGYLYVSGLTTPACISCYSLDGRLLNTINSQSESIRMAASGVVIVRITTPEGAYSHKVVVQ